MFDHMKISLESTEFAEVFNWRPIPIGWQVLDAESIMVNDLLNDIKLFDSSAKLFNVYGNSNFITLVCCNTTKDSYVGSAILIYLSKYAPIATYGQQKIVMNGSVSGANFLEPQDLYVITDNELQKIEGRIIDVIDKNGIKLINKAYLLKQLPEEFIEVIAMKSLSSGEQYLHGIFQYYD
jgi:hypothetical protein